MKPMALNLSKMKKVDGDDKSSTFMHPSGHKMVIAHSGVSALQKKQLENMPVQKFDDGGGVQADAPIDKPMNSNMEIEKIPESDNTPAQDVQQGPQSVPDQSPVSPPQKQPQTPQEAAVSGYREEQEANIAKANALVGQGSAESGAIRSGLKKIEDLPTQNEIVKANKDASDNLFKAYQENPKIDPNHYWKDHSRLAAFIGEVLGGQDVVKQINGQIDRDIDAQKNEQHKAENLWTMNRKALGEDLSADLTTKNQLYTNMKFQIDRAASGSRNAVEMANAKIANAKIDQEIAMNNFKISLMNPTSDNPDPSSRIQFLVPPEKQAKVADEIDAAKNTVANSVGIMDAFEEAAKEVRPMTGGTGTSLTSFVPGLKSPGQSALIARLGPTFKDVEGTVRQAAMDNMEHNVSPRFGDSDETINEKRKSLQEYMASKSSAALSKSFGIDLSKYPTTNINAMRPSPKKDPVMKSKSGRPMIQRNEKWYYQ